jgi:hypothetical protein
MNMSLEEKVVKLALKINKEEFENGEKSNLKTFGQLRDLIKNANREIEQGAGDTVKCEFENKLGEYSNMTSNKPPFSLIFDVAKDDYAIPQREPEEELSSFLGRSQEGLNQLQEEVDVVKRTIGKFEKIRELYARREEYKKAIMEDLEAKRGKTDRTPIDKLFEEERVKLNLPKVYLSEIFKEAVQEKLQSGEYEKSNGELMPVIQYEGKKIKAGIIYPVLNRLRDKGRPITWKKEDVEVSLCEDFDVFIRWLESIKNSYKMTIDKGMEMGKYRFVRLEREKE